MNAITLNVYVANGEPVTTPVEWTPNGTLFFCHYYLPGNSYDSTGDLSLEEISKLAPKARFHKPPTPTVA